MEISSRGAAPRSQDLKAFNAHGRAPRQVKYGVLRMQAVTLKGNLAT